MAGDILELARLFGAKDGLESDLYETAEFLRQNIMNKYVTKINRTLTSKEKSIVENPSREVTLLRALKNYAGEDARSGIERAIEAINFVNTARGIQSEVGQAAEEINAGIVGMSSDGEESAGFAPNLVGAVLMAAMLERTKSRLLK